MNLVNVTLSQDPMSLDNNQPLTNSYTTII
jgi:hypothetical protein